MQLIKIDPTFYVDHAHLVQALDNHGGAWQAGKTRGYGIPIRSNISHKAAYLTVRNLSSGNGLPYGKGLDFSKALFIPNSSYISAEVFKIPPKEHQKLVSKQLYIANIFEKYVEKYINAVSKADKNILNSNEYRHTTLQNYHTELGI
jgi:protein AbiQ